MRPVIAPETQPIATQLHLDLETRLPAFRLEQDSGPGAGPKISFFSSGKKRAFFLQPNERLKAYKRLLATDNETSGRSPGLRASIL
ncbi:MAG: hypothetical protein J2P49_05770 [Methylocapsa sp.]|nr:hypothetical protein [Methylocapsa sp.]